MIESELFRVSESRIVLPSLMIDHGLSLLN